jgi:hypothetical protein
MWAVQEQAHVLSDHCAGAGLPPLPGSFAALAAPQQQAPVFQQGGGYSRASAQQVNMPVECFQRTPPTVVMPATLQCPDQWLRGQHQQTCCSLCIPCQACIP